MPPVVEKKLSAGERRRDAQTRWRKGEEEGPNTTRKKADTADVAGERNAAGISERKLGGRVRRRGSGAGGERRAVQGERGTKRGGIRSGDRGEGVCFRHLKPAVSARILFSLSS